MSGSPHEQILRDAAVSLRETIQKLNDVQGNESKMVFQLISNASELVTQMDTVCNLLSRPNSTDHISLEPLAQLSLESEDDDEHTVPVFVPTSVHFSATPAVQFISEDQGDAMTLEEFQTYKLVLTQGNCPRCHHCLIQRVAHFLDQERFSKNSNTINRTSACFGLINSLSIYSGEHREISKRPRAQLLSEGQLTRLA